MDEIGDRVVVDLGSRTREPFWNEPLVVADPLPVDVEAILDGHAAQLERLDVLSDCVVELVDVERARSGPLTVAEALCAFRDVEGE